LAAPVIRAIFVMGNLFKLFFAVESFGQIPDEITS
jgi:hypothetical protein